ncbi:MAG: hypothetical protein IKW46_02145 [Bacteroidaceae bacterium]|nr:hypothetical protein [Bacteroidaceae bacterium]
MTLEKFKKLQLAHRKRVLINTALVNAHCGLNHFIREIVTKHISKVVTELNYEHYMGMAQNRPLEFIDMCCGAVWNELKGGCYCGYSIGWHWDNRYKINPHSNYNG